jgi:hypothetical protein
LTNGVVRADWAWLGMATVSEITTNETRATQNLEIKFESLEFFEIKIMGTCLSSRHRRRRESL